MTITLTELLAEIGNDNLFMQPLDQCITKLQRHKDHIRITFGSEVEFSLEGTKEFGIVVWVDREVANAARDRLLHREPSPFSSSTPCQTQAPEEDSQQ